MKNTDVHCDTCGGLMKYGVGAVNSDGKVYCCAGCMEAGRQEKEFEKTNKPA